MDIDNELEVLRNFQAWVDEKIQVEQTKELIRIAIHMYSVRER